MFFARKLYYKMPNGQWLILHSCDGVAVQENLRAKELKPARGPGHAKPFPV